MEDFLNVIFNYGVGVACVIYLMYFQSTTMREMLNTLNGINNRLSVIEDKLESKSKKKKDTEIEE